MFTYSDIMHLQVSVCQGKPCLIDSEIVMYQLVDLSVTLHNTCLNIICAINF